MISTDTFLPIMQSFNKMLRNCYINMFWTTGKRLNQEFNKYSKIIVTLTRKFYVTYCWTNGQPLLNNYYPVCIFKLHLLLFNGIIVIVSKLQSLARLIFWTKVKSRQVSVSLVIYCITRIEYNPNAGSQLEPCQNAPEGVKLFLLIANNKEKESSVVT